LRYQLVSSKKGYINTFDLKFDFGGGGGGDGSGDGDVGGDVSLSLSVSMPLYASLSLFPFLSLSFLYSSLPVFSSSLLPLTKINANSP
jgi:hypothetical protein